MGGNDATVAKFVMEQALGFHENCVDGYFGAETAVILVSVIQMHKQKEHLKSAETATEIGTKVLKDPLSSFPGMQQKSLPGISLVEGLA